MSLNEVEKDIIRQTQVIFYENKDLSRQQIFNSIKDSLERKNLLREIDLSSATKEIEKNFNVNSQYHIHLMSINVSINDIIIFLSKRLDDIENSNLKDIEIKPSKSLEDIKKIFIEIHGKWLDSFNQ